MDPYEGRYEPASGRVVAMAPTNLRSRRPTLLLGPMIRSR